MYFSLLGARRRRIVADLAQHLQPHAVEMVERWRRATPLPGRTAENIARLFLAAPWALLARGDFHAFAEHIDYTARRIAKLRVPLHAIGEGLLTQVKVAEPYLAGYWPGRSPEMAAVLDAFQHVAFLSAVRAYDGVQRAALDALFGVMNAELEAASLGDLLQRLLSLASRAFAARWAGILLLAPDESGRHDLRRGPLRHAALYGLDAGLVCAEAPAGLFFRQVLRAAGPGFVVDAANDPRVGQPYFRALEIKSVWAVPLRRHPGGPNQVLGVLHVDFDRIYECLPQERDLLKAFARRSTLAIERAHLLESVRAGHAHIRRLSRALLGAQENERRRMGRDLHDAAGQTFMATRLYLEMAQRRLDPGHRAAAPIRDGLASVDEGISGLRRIIHDLAPLGLKEFGLAPAVRRLVAGFRHAQRVPVRLQLALPRRMPQEIETLAFRVVQEGLTNVARHARAHRVWLELRQTRDRLRIRLADDGVGLPAVSPRRAGFGLTAMRERIELAGGTLRLTSNAGGGSVVLAELPLTKAAAEAGDAAPAGVPLAAVAGAG